MGVCQDILVIERASRAINIGVLVIHDGDKAVITENMNIQYNTSASLAGCGVGKIVCYNNLDG